MISFEYQNPTRIVYGNDSIQKFPSEIRRLGTKPLLVYGSKSIHENGAYERIVQTLKDAGIECEELGGGMRKATLKNLRKGIEKARSIQADVIIGIGAGVCIDLAKAIALGSENEEDIWDILTGQTDLETLKAPRAAAIAAAFGSGSEMDGNVEIDDEDSGRHGSIGSFIKTYPRFSILDPTLVNTASYEFMAYLGAIIMVQALEQYFCDTASTPLQNGFLETIVKTVLDCLYDLKKDPMISMPSAICSGPGH